LAKIVTKSRAGIQLETCYNPEVMPVSTIKMTARQFLELGEDPPGGIGLGLSAISPLTSSSRMKVRAKRAAEGDCIHCGYDLRGSDQVCPECGRVAIKQ
jgi:hypothetical protein